MQESDTMPDIMDIDVYDNDADPTLKKHISISSTQRLARIVKTNFKTGLVKAIYSIIR